MASSSSKAVIRGEEDGGQEEQNMTSLDSLKRSRSVDRGLEGERREAGGIWWIVQNAWARWFWVIGLCRSQAEPTLDQRLICTQAEPTLDQSLISTQAEATSDRSWYHSARIQRMMDKWFKFSTEVESSIEASKVHWSEVDRAVAEAEHSAEANRKHYEVLRRRRYVRDEGGQLVATQLESIDEDRDGNLFIPIGHWDELVVGEKLAEGGQAEIYAAHLPRGRHAHRHEFVVKVFKAGSVLQELEKQIPPTLLNRFHSFNSHCLPLWTNAILLKDGRFAFIMKRLWGDLRRLIDKQMMDFHNENTCAPFPPHVALDLMIQIANDMRSLHEQDPPILHNDLKAANVLVKGLERRPYLKREGGYIVTVADYECSVGVVGTGIWRAPEILQKLKDVACVTNIVFKEKCDVYSYGMTCYEIVTGRLPYEEYDFLMARNYILNGERPKLPLELDPKVKKLIMRCWHPNPLERPSFKDIHTKLSSPTEFNLPK